MSTLKIEIPEGFEVENFDHKTGEIKFRPKLMRRIERITTFDQVCSEMGVDPKGYEVTETNVQSRALQIMKRLMLIAECFQEGEPLNLYDTKQYKWYPWFNLEGSGFRFLGSDCTDTVAVLGPLLCFPSEKISNYVGRTFIDEYQSLAELNNTSNQK
jgi:hypothetical protein